MRHRYFCSPSPMFAAIAARSSPDISASCGEQLVAEEGSVPVLARLVLLLARPCSTPPIWAGRPRTAATA